MLTHSQIWRAIDALAARHGLSPSGLAKLAGLDPTTFNKSKRGADERQAALALDRKHRQGAAATGASLEDFVALVARRKAREPPLRAVPLIGLAQAGQPGLFRRCRISGRRRLGGDRLSRSRRRACLCAGDHRQFHAAGLSRRRPHRGLAVGQSCRRGDRVVVKTHAGEVMAKQLGRAHRQRIELK